MKRSELDRLTYTLRSVCTSLGAVDLDDRREHRFIFDEQHAIHIWTDMLVDKNYFAYIQTPDQRGGIFLRENEYEDARTAVWGLLLKLFKHAPAEKTIDMRVSLSNEFQRLTDEYRLEVEKAELAKIEAEKLKKALQVDPAENAVKYGYAYSMFGQAPGQAEPAPAPPVLKEPEKQPDPPKPEWKNLVLAIDLEAPAYPAGEENADADALEEGEGEEDEDDEEPRMLAIERIRAQMSILNVATNSGSLTCFYHDGQHIDVVLYPHDSEVFATIKIDDIPHVDFFYDDYATPNQMLVDLHERLSDRFGNNPMIGPLLTRLEKEMEAMGTNIQRGAMSGDELRQLSYALNNIAGQVGNEWTDSYGNRIMWIETGPLSRGARFVQFDQIGIRLSEANYAGHTDALLAMRDYLKNLKGQNISEAIRTNFINAINTQIPQWAAETPVVNGGQEKFMSAEKKSLAENQPIGTDRTAKDAFILGAKLGAGSTVTKALDKAILASLPEPMREQVQQNPIVMHVLQMLSRLALMKAGGHLKQRWKPLEYVEEAGFYASAVEVQQMIDSAMTFLVPFCGAVVKNFMADSSVHEVLEAAGVAKDEIPVVNEEKVQSEIKTALRQGLQGMVESGKTL